MKKNRRRALLAVLAAVAAAVLFVFLGLEREYAPIEPDTEAVIRSGMVVHKLLRRSANAESIRERAVLDISGEEIDALLAVLQSRMNPLLEKVPHNEHGLFFRLSRDGRWLKLAGVYPLPGRIFSCSGTLLAEPEITQQEVILKVAQLKCGLCPLPRAAAAEKLDGLCRNFLQSDYGKLFRAAVVSLEVLPNGNWRLVYRPFLMKKLLISRFS